MAPADLYTQTSAQTVNNGTHACTHAYTHTQSRVEYAHTYTNTHPLPCIHFAVTEPTCNYQCFDTCPHTLLLKTNVSSEEAQEEILYIPSEM